MPYVGSLQTLLRMPETRSRGTILAIATIASFFVPYLTSSITIALPSIGSEFSLDAVSLGWVVSSYVLSTAICIVPFWRLADIYGRKKFFLAGIALMTAASLLASFAWSLATLIGCRVIQGAGGAMIFTTSVAIVTAVYPPERRGWALGITLASVYSGLSLGPLFGGVLTTYFGWRSIFLVIVPLGLLVGWLTLGRVRDEWCEARGAGFDIPGSVLYAGALFSLMYGLTIVPDPAAVAFVAASVVLFAAFIRWESRTGSPVLELAVFRHNTGFTFSNIAALINYASTYAVAFLLSLYLQYTRGLAPEFAGLLLVAQPAVQTVFSPVAGRLSDRVEPRLVASAGMALTTAGTAIFVFLSPETPLPFIVAVLLLLGLGYGLFSSPNTNAIMSSVEPRHYGVASSMVATMRAIGQLTSIAIAMMIFSVVLGRVQVTPEVYPSLLSAIRFTFLVFAALSAFGVFASYARGSIRNPVPEPDS
jgi:EmrB/QacA subfamily drug resistance transporter